MRDRTVNRVESWDARPFSGGFSTLRDMSDASFSGVAVSGDAWLFMLNGRIVGIVDGDIDEFEDASGTMYEAPDPSLPLLFSMQEREGTTQAKYYTNDTPLADADTTLSDANFTGYVELSENVLSGDYYLVYYGGRALPVAFVGTTNELKTGDEAYDLANDEVGVYEVIKTPVNVTQVPGPRSDETESKTEAGAADVAAADTAAEEAVVEESGAPEESDAATGRSKSEPEPASEATAEPSAEAAVAEEYEAAADEPVVESAEPSDTGPIESAETNQSATEEGGSESTVDASTRGSDAGGQTDAVEKSDTAEQTEESEPVVDDSSVFSEEEQWRQTKSIPSLSPSEREKRRQQQEERSAGSEQRAHRPKSERPEGTTESTQATGESRSREQSPTESSQLNRQQRSESANVGDAGDANAEAGRSKAASSEPGAAESRARATGSEPAGTQSDGVQSTDAQSTGAQSDRVDGGGQPSAAVKQRIVDLESKIERIDAERDGLKDDLESVRAERDSLQRRVRQLENTLEDAGGAPTSGPTLTPDEALAGTNLFVRYGSRGAPTLDGLTGKNPDPEAINKNLRIDHHTQFESTDASVDGEPFIEFLEETSAFRFVSWLVRDLPYEVLDAGHRNDLDDLYDVVPEIDRAELQGVVEVEGEEGNERREFDIVLRDRMGNPLIVAELNDERDAVSGDEMESLIESARVVGEGAEGLGAAFYVTASFFEPNALENAAAATENGGILSRSDRASYVKLARKHGFHLCLAEDRNDTFHLTVPEL